MKSLTFRLSTVLLALAATGVAHASKEDMDVARLNNSLSQLSSDPALGMYAQAEQARAHDAVNQLAQARSRDDGAQDAASGPRRPAGPMAASDGTAPAPGHPLLAEAVSGPAPARQAPCGTTAQARAETVAGPGPQAELDLDGAPTRYGGLVYLFATAAAAGIPDVAYTDDALGQRPTSWLAFYLAGILAGPGPGVWEDPAVRAVAGLPPQAVAPGPEPTAAQRARLADLADGWAGATARAIGGDEDPRALVTRICSRTGRVVHDRGWIEFRLRLADVDLDVRRAGLDVDPGFVSWLGAVVVIRYE